LKFKQVTLHGSGGGGGKRERGKKSNCRGGKKPCKTPNLGVGGKNREKNTNTNSFTQKKKKKGKKKKEKFGLKCEKNKQGDSKFVRRSFHEILKEKGVV